ncbi:hypothetical protein WG66_012955 [Moniliophthora roreri]|nr:hypothetical protein WG66_012955 [Moniliophthora roreri]
MKCFNRVNRLIGCRTSSKLYIYPWNPLVIAIIEQYPKVNESSLLFSVDPGESLVHGECSCSSQLSRDSYLRRSSAGNGSTYEGKFTMIIIITRTATQNKKSKLVRLTQFSPHIP